MSETPLPPTSDGSKKNNQGLIIAIVVVVLLCCCCIGALGAWYAWNNGDAWFGNAARLITNFA